MKELVRYHVVRKVGSLAFHLMPPKLNPSNLFRFIIASSCSAPYAYIDPYVYGTSHMCIPIWDAHTRMGWHFVPYEYFICMFYFFTGLWILLL